MPFSRLWSQVILYLNIKLLSCKYKYKQHYIIFNLHLGHIDMLPNVKGKTYFT